MERLTREQRRAQTRDRLLDAAQRLFAERGLSASLEEVAAAAGLTKGAVYSNFASKEDLLLGIIERRLATASEPGVGARLADSSRPPQERFAALSEDYPNVMAQPGNKTFALLMIEFWTAAMRSERVRAKYAEALQAIRGQIAGELSSRLDPDVLPLPASHLAVLMMAIDIGVAIQHLVDPANVPGDIYGAAYARLLGADAATSTGSH